jgi:prepilin-type N-terminal cleavage/methylation domain-containing protein
MNSRRGFTLMEVMFALAITSVAVMISGSIFNIVTANQSRARNFSKAHNIAVLQLELLLSIFPGDSKLTVGTHTLALDSNGNVVTAGGVYTVQWVIAANTPIPNIMRIALSVNWSDFGFTRGVNFLTFRASL